MIHRRTHPEYVEGCFGCKISTVAVFEMTGQAAQQRTRNRQWHRDVDAYKRARKSGLRPTASTTQAVEKAERQAESEARALKKLGVNKLEEAQTDWKGLT